MNKRSYVLPENLDTTRGHLWDSNSKKYYVDTTQLVDGLTVKSEGNKISINSEGLRTFTGKALAFNPTTKKLDVRADESTITINGDNSLMINPQFKDELIKRIDNVKKELQSKDKMLEKVEYDNNTKELVFHIGSETTDDDSILRLPIGDLIVTHTSGAIQGDGSTGNPVKLKIDPSSRGVSITNQGLRVDIPSICEYLGELPKSYWEDGMTLLAKKKTGQCVQLAPRTSIFQDVGLGIGANRIRGFTDDEYFLTYRVTNTGEDTNERTTLEITYPNNLGSEYRIEGIKTQLEGGDRIEKISNTKYEIYGLEKGGVAAISFQVLASKFGSYQFGGTINPHSALDKTAENDNASIILNIQTREDPNYVPSVDCPLIVATDLASNKQLVQKSAESDHSMWSQFDSLMARTNLYTSRDNGNNLRIKLQNASTVVVKYFASGSDTILVQDKRRYFHTSIVNAGDWNNQQYPYRAVRANYTMPEFRNVSIDKYSFDPHTGILEFRNVEDCNTLFIWARPQGNNCRWQLYALAFSDRVNSTIAKSLSITGLPSDKYRIITSIRPNNHGRSGKVPEENYGTSVVIGQLPDTYANIGAGNSIEEDHEAVVTLKKGTAYNFTVNQVGYSGIKSYTARGKTTIVPEGEGLRVTVSADAKPTDSVRYARLKVIIED